VEAAPVVDAPVEAPVDAAPVVDAPVEAPVDAAPVLLAPVAPAPVEAPVDAAPVVDTPVSIWPVIPVDTVNLTPVRYFGTGAAEAALGGAGADILLGHGGDDALMGEGGNDVLRGDDGDDYLDGGAGRDMIFGGVGNDDILAGQDADMVYGDAGQDRIFGEEGDDILNGGLGDDTLHGDAGDDRFVASELDGNDIYDGGLGTDTLDMSAILANITVDLGIGLMGRGSAIGAGSDTLFGIENVMTGSGHDTILANGAVNVLDGGAGDNSFVFRSVADAQGDTILGFTAGDMIDLSGIDANALTGGLQAFTLVGRDMATGAGELAFSHLTENGHDMTVITGNTGTDAFELKVQGHHELTNDQFSL
jgi:Ca2+-binding RTX toxin-like protein